MRRTKIVCTIGPASESPAMLKKLIHAGMNVARLNFSHGTHANHRQLFQRIHAAAKAVGKPVAILQDLQGPRIRLGEIAKEGIQVKKGEEIRFVYGSSLASQERGGVRSIPLAYPLYRFVKKGNTLLVDDGKLAFRVERVSGEDIVARVVSPGLVKTHKGVNTPGVHIIAPALTKKDKDDLTFGLSLGVDFVTLSFVKDAKDLRLLRTLIARHRPKVAPKIVAKLERPEAIENLETIVEETDAVMIGRGDLALETPPEDVPLVQKQIIEACLRAGKPVIVATQMLESMTTNARPTRAEVSDIANAVIDHTDATMLSGETASGQFPVEAVTMMAKTIVETEASRYDDLGGAFLDTVPFTMIRAHARSVRDAVGAGRVSAAIVADPEVLSAVVQMRLEVPILFLVVHKAHGRQALLSWNVIPMHVRRLPAMRDAWAHTARDVRRQFHLPSSKKIAAVTGTGYMLL